MSNFELSSLERNKFITIRTLESTEDMDEIRVRRLGGPVVENAAQESIRDMLAKSLVEEMEAATAQAAPQERYASYHDGYRPFMKTGKDEASERPRRQHDMEAADLAQGTWIAVRNDKAIDKEASVRHWQIVSDGVYETVGKDGRPYEAVDAQFFSNPNDPESGKLPRSMPLWALGMAPNARGLYSTTIYAEPYEV